eukprot:COSAG02_NODE_60739_length_270_cov_0.906433_1_plen_33_part_10
MWNKDLQIYLNSTKDSPKYSLHSAVQTLLEHIP